MGRDLGEDFNVFNSVTGAKVVDRQLKDYWATGRVGNRSHEDFGVPKNKYKMRLAHGYSHTILVARRAYMLALDSHQAPERLAFLAGLLHDAYRPVQEGASGQEKHGPVSARIAEAILTQKISGLPKVTSQEIEDITQAISHHDLSLDESRLIVSSPGLPQVLFLADKGHMNLERLMAYVYDYTEIYRHGDRRYEECPPALTMCDSISWEFAKKYARDLDLVVSIARGFDKSEAGDMNRECADVIAAYDNTVGELRSQRAKEARKDDYPDTIKLFWAFKEAVANFRYLVHSQRELHDLGSKTDDDLWESVHLDMGTYNLLLLTNLDREPFRDMVNYSNWFREMIRKNDKTSSQR